MGLKGYRLWVMGQLDSTCRAPPLLLQPFQLLVAGLAREVVHEDGEEKVEEDEVP